MRPEVRKYLFDILTAGEEILSFTAGKSMRDLFGDRVLQLVVEREFEIIGIALRHTLEMDLSLEDRISGAAKIIGFRNRLAHGYDNIEYATVWVIITDHLPQLLADVRCALE